MDLVSDRTRILQLRFERHDYNGVLINVWKLRYRHRATEYRAHLRTAIHDEIQWHEDGPFNLPVNNQIPWRTSLGLTGPTLWNGFPIHFASMFSQGRITTNTA